MKFMQKLLLCFGLACTLGVLGQTAKGTDDVLIRALKDEMQRSLAELQIDFEPKPYFIAYVVDSGSSNIVQSILGATADTSQRSNRRLNVVVRVGSRELDNTNFTAGGVGLANFGVGGGIGNSFPLTDSYDELRRVIWMNTDAAYKKAVSELSAKKTALEQQSSLERANDFNQEEPFEYVVDRQVDSVDAGKFTAFANEISAVMKGHPDLQSTSTVVSYVANTRTYIDSDGNFNRLVSSLCSLRSQVTAQAEDGSMVNDHVTVYASSCAKLYANVEEIKQRHQALVASVREFMAAEQVRAYTGPVLISEEASAGFFAQAFGSRAGATALPVSEAGSFNMFGGLQNPFMDKIGARVLPRFLSVVNDPTVSEYEGMSLLGSYVVDGQGMPSRRTELIKDGQLQALLTTRSPVKDFEKSTGSSRQGAPMPGNLFISTNESMTEEELKQELLLWVRDSGNEFGIVIKRFNDLESTIAGSSFEGIMALSQSLIGGGIPIFPTLRAYKVNLDGSEVPIRSLSVPSFSDGQLKDIVAVSDTLRAYNVAQTFAPATFMAGWLGAGLGGMSALGIPSFIGVVSPSLLLEELSLQGGSAGNPRLPIVAHPESD